MQGAHDLYHVLLALAAVIVAGRLLGIVCCRLHQPPVIGEVLAGIVLGPSVLGSLAPSAQKYLLPDAIAPYLFIIAQLGVILYMFLVGLELNAGLLRERGRAALIVSAASMAAPFVLGAALAVALHDRLAMPGVSTVVFALFVGVAMSITAFPVLARILTDRGLTHSPVGSLAMICAALGDVLAWCLLALVVGVAQSKLGGALLTTALTAAYVLGMWLIVRPLMARVVAQYDRGGGITQGMAAWVFIGLLLSALTTELIGIHALFGAFLFGAVIPHDSRIASDFLHKLQELVQVLLLPAFFAYTGMRTQIGLVSGWTNILLCLAIIALATLGKFGGSALAARACGLGWRDASAIGILMNTRGLMELIVLNIGLELGVISPTLFAMMVLMALATTIATTPVLDWLGVSDETGAATKSSIGLSRNRTPRPKNLPENQ
jgi:Kef-type K+ transport system membrane component KefB